MGGLSASLAIWWLAPLVCFPPLRVGKQFGALLHSFVLCNPPLKIQVLKTKASSSTSSLYILRWIITLFVNMFLLVFSIFHKSLRLISWGINFTKPLTKSNHDLTNKLMLHCLLLFEESLERD